MKTSKLGAMILVLSLLLTSCGGVEPPRPGIDIPATQRAQIAGPVGSNMAQGTTEPTLQVDVPQPVATTETTPSEVASDVIVTAVIKAPETIRLHDTGRIEVVLYAMLPESVVLDAVDIVLPVSLMSVEILDAYPSVPGVQVVDPLLLITPITPLGQVLTNEVDEMGVVHYSVSGLNFTGEIHFTVFYIDFRAVYPGEVELHILSLDVRTKDGIQLPVNYDAFAFIQIVEDAAGEPTPVLQPTAQPTAQPTEIAGGGLGELPVVVPSILQEGVYYRILRGENLFRIGQRFNVNWQQIAAANGIRDEHYVPAGMILYIPVAAPVGTTAYYIRPGDTLYSICRGLNLRVVDVAALNGIPAPFNYIRADTWLKLAP